MEDPFAQHCQNEATNKGKSMWFIINSHPRKLALNLSAGQFSRLKRSNKEALEFVEKNLGSMQLEGETVKTLFKSINGFDFIKVMELTNAWGSDDDDTISAHTRILPDIKCSQCNNGATRFAMFTPTDDQGQLMSIWFKVNNHPDEKIQIQSVEEYSDILRSNLSALAYAQSELMYILDPNEELEVLYKSADGVDFVPVITPIDASEKGDNDDPSISIVPDITCELCKGDNMRADKVNSIGSSDSNVNYQERLKEFRHEDSSNGKTLSSIENSCPSQPGSCEITKGKKTSVIWNHCTKVTEGNRNYLVCSYCQLKFIDNKNTTNMTKHLKTKHPLFFSQSKEIEEPKTSTKENHSSTKRKLISLESNSQPSKKPFSPAEVPKKIVKLTPSITSAFQNLKSFQDGGVKEDEITNLVLHMICVDKMPLSTVENPGFGALMKKGFPLYKIPSRTTITDRLERKYSLLKNRVVEKSQKASSYCITADNWTDRSNQSYMGLTIHYLDPKTLVYQSVCLGCIPLYERHTSDYLESAIKTIFSEFDIDIDKISLMLTDSDASMKKSAISVVGPDRYLACIAHACSHVLPNSVKSVPALGDIIVKVKSIVCVIRHSTVATDKLIQSQIDDTTNKEVTNRKTALRLSQDCPTRWTSTVEMLNRYLSLELYIPMALHELKKSRVNSLSAEESEILTDVLPIMKLIAKVIRDISGDKYPTCSIIIPIVNCLELKINAIQPCTDVGKDFKVNIIQNMKDKLFHVENVPSLSIATILDPRFKKLHFHSKQTAADIVRDIDRELKKEKPAQSTPKVLVEIGDDDDIWKAHDSLLVQHQDRLTTIRDSDLDEELEHYLKLPLLPRDANHLQYWKSEEAQFPKLAKLALKKLANLATTVPSERQFSKAGLIDTPNRSQLTAER